MRDKQKYTAPAIEILEVEHEGIMAGSIDFGYDGPINSSSNQVQHDTSLSYDIDEMITNIFTYKP